MVFGAIFGALVTVFKPVVVLWAGLNAIDDLSMLLRVGRLAAVLLPGGDKTDMCDVCDDVMGDLLSGSDGLEAIPCKYACLGIGGCIDMCEKVKASSANATNFPCVAAGYCEADDKDDGGDVDCQVVPILRCAPARYCKRKRVGLRMTCTLKPGIGRWVGMKNAVGQVRPSSRFGARCFAALLCRTIAVAWPHLHASPGSFPLATAPRGVRCPGFRPSVLTVAPVRPPRRSTLQRLRTGCSSSHTVASPTRALTASPRPRVSAPSPR